MIQQSENKPYFLGKNLSYLMGKQHETIPQLSDVTGAAYSSISDWRTGKKVPRSGYLEKIAQHYSVNISDLLFTDLENGVSTNEFQSISPVAKAEHQIPVIGIIACGEPILAEQNIEDYTKLHLRMLIYQWFTPLCPPKIVQKLCRISKKVCEKIKRH